MQRVLETKLWPRNRTFCKNGPATGGKLPLEHVPASCPRSTHASATCPLVFVDLNGCPEVDPTCVALTSIPCLFPLALMMWTQQEWFLLQPDAASGKMNRISCFLFHVSFIVSSFRLKLFFVITKQRLIQGNNLAEAIRKLVYDFCTKILTNVITEGETRCYFSCSLIIIIRCRAPCSAILY